MVDTAIADAVPAPSETESTEPMQVVVIENDSQVSSYDASHVDNDVVDTPSTDLVGDSYNGGENDTGDGVDGSREELLTEELETKDDDGSSDGRLSEQVFETVATIAAKQKSQFPTSVKPPGLTSPDTVRIDR